MKAAASPYSPQSVAEQCRSQPLQVLARFTEISTTLGKWALDASAKQDDPLHEPALAKGLRRALVSLGPTFVKVGQVMSSRVDLLPPAYVDELRHLTDRVEAYPSDAAREILREEWKDASPAVAASAEALPYQPIAAASLGQVYRLNLKGIGPCAVKVRRPGVREQITLDLFLLRMVAPSVQDALNLNTDLVALVDEYGAGLIDELDYREEALNALYFQASVWKLGLKSVCVAEPLLDLTTERVLVTRWVEGDRMDKIEDPDEFKRLRGVSLNAYLAMLLEIGVLHADPHPGNLIRTKDGRLCIIDWGLVAVVSPSLRQSCLSYITHLLAKEYNKIPGDLIDLGFVVEGKKGAMKDEEVARAIADIFRGLAAGGNAQRRFADVLPAMGEVRQRYGNIARIPSYFVYILRTFTVLEGLGLERNGVYRIVDDCYTYLSAWVCRAKTEEAKPVLKALLYGGASLAPDARRALGLLRALASNNIQQAEAEQKEAKADGAAPDAADKPGANDWADDYPSSPAVRDMATEEAARVVDVVAREVIELIAGGLLVRTAGLTRSEEDEAMLDSLLELAALSAEDSQLLTDALAGIGPAQLQRGLEAGLGAVIGDSDARLGPMVNTWLQRFVAALLERFVSRVDRASRENLFSSDDGGEHQGTAKAAKEEKSQPTKSNGHGAKEEEAAAERKKETA